MAQTVVHKDITYLHIVIITGAITANHNIKDIIYSKGHQGNEKDTGLSNVTDEELEQRINDKNTSSKDKKRYQKEQKARGLRNTRKRNQYNRSK